MEAGVPPLPPLIESQLMPAGKVGVAVKETLPPVVVVTGSVCELNELPTGPRNSSTGTVDVRSGSAVTFKITATLDGATPWALKEMFPRYWPAARPVGLTCTATVAGAAPEAADVIDSQPLAAPVFATAVQASAPEPALATLIDCDTGVADPTDAFTTTAGGVRVN